LYEQKTFRKRRKNMNFDLKQSVQVIIALVIFTVGSTFAQQRATDASAANNSIAGSWSVHSIPAAAAPFRGLITFSEGGGMIASAQGDNLITAGSLGTPGHGSWTRTGNREFLFTFIQILYNAAGDYDGKIRVRHTASMNRDGTDWTGQLTLEVFDPSDVIVFTSTGSTTATRIVPLPLLQ
jgi:hypothetical protein